jgi:hypothetical protein
MDDLSICKRIAEIDGVDVFEDRGLHGFQLTRKDSYEAYNPLTDDALCFQLMLKHNIVIRDRGNDCYLCSFNGYEHDFRIADKSPNKAILLAIIEAHKD